MARLYEQPKVETPAIYRKSRTKHAQLSVESSSSCCSRIGLVRFSFTSVRRAQRIPQFFNRSHQVFPVNQARYVK